MSEKEHYKIKFLIITQNSEIEISSHLIILIFYIKSVLKLDPDITIIDNCSTDRTVELAKEIGVKIYRYKSRKSRKVIIETALKIAQRNDFDRLVLLDIAGGNTSDDAISLIARSLEEGKRFASAYIQPRAGDGYLGCWAFDSELIKNVGYEMEVDIKKQLFELASSENLEVLSIDEKFSVKSKRQRKKLFRLMKRSPGEMMTQLVRFHPLFFYGSVGLIIILTALFTGFYTINYFYSHNELNYFPAFLTVALVMLGGFFMVSGLMLNALNVIIEKIEAMKEWLE